MKTTKDKVIDAASQLFYHNGFQGTSVRDIAQKARVNISQISYYFKNKQGLLEYIVTHYYEALFETIEENMETNDKDVQAYVKLLELIFTYRLENFQLTTYIQRELSMDSTFVREMAVTYLAKEEHMLEDYFEAVFSHVDTHMRQIVFMQLKGMLMAPFVTSSNEMYIHLDQVGQRQFRASYIKKLEEWLQFIDRNGEIK